MSSDMNPQCPDPNCENGIVWYKSKVHTMPCPNPVHATICPTCGTTNRPNCPDPYHIDPNAGLRTVHATPAAEPTQAEREYAVHKAHCFMVVQPENEFMGCKYGRDEDCPMYQPEPTAESADMPRLLFKSGASWSVDDPKGELEDALFALLATAKAEGRREGAVEELEKIDQAYRWKSIVTYDGFKKWRANRLTALKGDTPDET